MWAGALLWHTPGTLRPLMCPRTCGTCMAPCSGAARRVRLYQGALLGCPCAHCSAGAFLTPSAPWECSCPITLLADPIGLCHVRVLDRMVSGSVPAALSLLVPSVVLCTGRGQDTEAFLSTWHSHPSHCFQRKDALFAWLSVKQQLSVEKAPLYAWTSCAGGKLPSISRCRNSLFAPLCLITAQESLSLPFSCPCSAG